MSQKTIELGDYILKPLDDENYWFEAPTGEGTGIDKKYVFNIIESYFTDTIDEYFKLVRKGLTPLFQDQSTSTLQKLYNLIKSKNEKFK